MACFKYLISTLVICGMFDKYFMVKIETRIGLIEHLLYQILRTDIPEIKEKLEALQNRRMGVTDNTAIQIDKNVRDEINTILTEFTSKTNIMLHGFAAEKRQRKYLNAVTDDMRVSIEGLVNQTAELAGRVNSNNQRIVDESEIVQLVTRVTDMLRGEIRGNFRQQIQQNLNPGLQRMKAFCEGLVNKTAELAERVDNQRIVDKPEIVRLVTEVVYELMDAIQDKGKQTQLGLESAIHQIEEMSRDIRDIKTKTYQKLQMLKNAVVCPKGWVRVMDSCIFFSKVEKSWAGARDYCKSIGSDLAEPFSKKAVLSLRHPATNGVVWLGANDILEEGRWTWESTGQPIDDDLWSDGEPSINDKYGIEENCLEFNHPELFNDRNCDQDHHFACEIKL